MRIRVHREARAELEAAAVWYDSEEPGLGDELLAEVARGLELIAAGPAAWPAVRCKALLRRFLLPRFPYAILFDTAGEELRVFAFGHTSRRPGYWRGRRFG